MQTETQTTVDTTSEVGNAVAGENALRNEALAAREALDKNYTRLSKCLYDIYTTQAWTRWGSYASFEGYIEQELDFSYRKALNLVEIWQKAVCDLNLPLDRIELIGWSKMSRLVRVLTEENSTSLLESAEKSTFRDVEAEVRRIRQSTPDDSAGPSQYRYKFVFGEDDKTIIDGAIAESKTINGTDVDSLALTQICDDWMTFQGSHPQAIPLGQRISMIEKAYGVKISVMEEGTKDSIPSNADINKILGIQ